MQKKKWFLYGLAAAMAVAMACGGDTKTSPASPTITAESTTDAASADGSTWKITAPTLSAPANGSTVDILTPNLVITNATSKYVAQTISTYRFVVLSAAGATVYDSGLVGAGAALTGHRVPADTLKAETTYTWKVRGENNSTTFGPWSSSFTFTTPKPATEGFQTATTLWDPLINGKTIGTAVNMEFTLNKGARTISTLSYIQWQLQQTLTSGDMSFYVDNFNPLAAGGKTKFATMSSNAADITTDPWRFTLEKRGVGYVSPGQVRWRIITGDATNAVNDGGPWQPTLDKTKTHFIKFTWGSNRVTLLIAEADSTTGVLGTTRLNVSASYKNTYRPNPHCATIGAEAGRAGADDASVPNMTVRYLWISDGNTARPAYPPLSSFLGAGGN
jgi:hypothetical protein